MFFYRKRNNKGFTLVELLVAMAVIGILMAQVGNIVYNCSTLYRNGSYEVELQTEAQQFIQQMEELLIDASALSWNHVDAISSDEIVITTSNNFVNKEYKIYLDKQPEDPYGIIYMDVTDKGSAEATEAYSATKVVMAEYVDTVSVNTDNFKDASKVELNVSMLNQKYRYYSSKEIYCRNDIGDPSANKTDEGAFAYDYALDCKRYATYDLEDLFCDFDEDGVADSGCTFTWSKKSPNAGTYYNLSGKELESKLDNAWNSSVSQAQIIEVRKDGKAMATIGVTTDKVLVGGDGTPGKEKGYTMGYLSNSSYRNDSYCQVFGVDLASASSAEYEIKIKCGEKLFFGTKTGGTFPGDKCSAGDIQNMADKQTVTGSDMNKNYGESDASGSNLKESTIKGMINTSDMWFCDEDHVTLTGTAPSIEYQVANQYKFKLAKTWAWTDKNSNSCVLGCAGDNSTVKDGYKAIIDKGGCVFTQVVYKFSNGKDLTVNFLNFPNDGFDSDTDSLKKKAISVGKNL